jgi:hypothetical protein
MDVLSHHTIKFGAGGENRTPVIRLETSSNAIIRHPLDTTFLLLSKWSTPCVYAAKAKSDVAKLSFAFSFV